MQAVKSILKKIGIGVLIPLAVYIIFGALRPNEFLKWSMVYSICLQSVATCILAWGISFCLTAGITDFSVAAERLLGSVCGVLLSRKMGVAGLVIGCMSISVIFAVVKGFLNSMIKMSSMIISVAYCFIIGSIGSLVQGSNSMILMSDVCYLGKSPAIWIIFFACGAVIYFLQHYSVFGANCRALGGSQKIARESGVSKEWTEAKAIAVASLFAGISGIVTTSYGAGTNAAVGLESMGIVFPAIIGFNIGMLLRKNVDITFGIIAGVVTMNILATGLVSLGIPSQLKDTVTGIFLLTIMCVNVIIDRRHELNLRRQQSEMNAKASAST